jgi:hypothetical protein
MQNEENFKSSSSMPIGVGIEVKCNVGCAVNKAVMQRVMLKYGLCI